MLITGFPAGPLAANCYVVAPGDGGGCVVIDPGQQAADPLRAVLTEHGLKPAAVLVTHGHFDHVAAAAAVCAEYGIGTFIGAADEYMLDDPLAALSEEFRAGITQLLAPDENVDEMRPREVTRLGGGEVLTIGGVTIDVFAVPGHTPGSMVYRVAGPIQGAGSGRADGDTDGDDVPEVLFTGDTLFAGSIGRTDLAGGSSSSILASIRDTLLTRPDAAIVLPGHGPATTVADERADNPFLRGLV